ncbi:MAG: response regulator [Deltaproteobacteria bacterium]|nr:response regulator [Deltaproteobacteria bacterium]
MLRQGFEDNRDESAEPRVRVLVVDDEPVQLESIARGLRLYGYECVGAAGAFEAMDVLYGIGGRGGGVDVLVTDLTMPRRSGNDLIKIVRAFRPDLPIVVITGLNPTPEIEEFERQGIPVIPKPFDAGKLDRDIRALLANVNDRGSARVTEQEGEGV